MSFDYLKAVDVTGVGVRAVAIGVSLLMQEPWSQLAQLFTTPLGNRFINVVCAPPGLMLGVPTTAAQAGPNMDMPVTEKRAATTEDIVYKPKTALSGLYTVGLSNIAIVPSAQNLESDEIDALRKYDAVVCPDESDARYLLTQSVKAQHTPPDPAQLNLLFAAHHLP